MNRVAIFLCCLLVAVLIAPQTTRAQAETELLPSWAGMWHGELTNLPLRDGAPLVEVTMEIGGFPVENLTCTIFRNTYTEAGIVKQVKDYQLCRGDGPDDLYIDEGDGVKLTTRWMGDVLVTPFKYDDTLLISTLRLRDDVLEEEIISITDKPAVAGVQPMSAQSIQRLVLHRVPPQTPEKTTLNNGN